MATKLTAFFLLRVFVCFVLTTVWSLGASLLFDAAVLICYIYQAPTPSPPSSLRESALCKIMLTIELSTIKVTTIYYICEQHWSFFFFLASHCKVTVTLDLTKNEKKKTPQEIVLHSNVYQAEPVAQLVVLKWRIVSSSHPPGINTTTFGGAPTPDMTARLWPLTLSWPDVGLKNGGPP